MLGCLYVSGKEIVEFLDAVFFISKGKDEGNGRDLNKHYDREQKGCGCINTVMQSFISTKTLVLSWSKWAVRLTNVEC